jgi:hypothetical protein
MDHPNSSTPTQPVSVPPSHLFIPYGCGFKDHGWGCAWRCIMMLLKDSHGF